MANPLAALALIAVSLLVLGGLFADVEQEILEPRTFEPSDYLLDKAQDIDPRDLPKLDDPNVDLNDITLPQDMDITLPEGTEIDGNLIRLAEDLPLILPEGASIEDFALDLDEWTGMEIPPGTTVDGDRLIFPPGTVLRLADGTVIPMPDGGSLRVPGATEDELRWAVQDGYIDAPPGSRLEAPRVESPGGWPITLPAGSEFVLPSFPGLPQGTLSEDTETTIPAGSYARRDDGRSSGTSAGGSGSGRSSGAGEEIQEAPDEEAPTTTEITGWSDAIRKDEPFDVEGFVHKQDGTGLSGARVAVFVNETKTTPGRHVGTALTRSDGTWLSRVTFPDDLPPADYQLVAQHEGTISDDTLWLPSWSDPPFSVRDASVLFAEFPTRTGVDTPTQIGARLVDGHDVPLAGKTIRIVIEGNDFLSTTRTTGNDGRVALDHTFQTSGTADISVFFDGDDHVDAANAAGSLEVQAFGFLLDGQLPIEASPGAPITIRGQATVDGLPTEGVRINIRAFGERETLASGPDGEVTFATDVHPDARLGRQIVGITIGPLGSSTALELPAFVRAQPGFEHAWPGVHHIGVPPTLDIRITDAQGNTLDEVRILAERIDDNETILDTTRATTDENGNAELALPVLDDATTRIRVRAPVSDDVAAHEEILDAVPVTVTATPQGSFVRGLRTVVAYQIEAIGPAGAQIASVTAGEAPGLDRASLRFGLESADVHWTTDGASFALVVPRDTPAGDYDATIFDGIPGAPVRTQVPVLEHAIVSLIEAPEHHDEGALSLTASARNDAGTRLRDVTLVFTARHGDTERFRTETTTDDDGEATVSIPASALSTLPVTIQVAKAADATTSAASHQATITSPATLWPLIGGIALIGAGIGGYAIWRGIKQGGELGVGPVIRALDPRPPPNIKITVPGRPDGLPLAFPPDVPIELNIAANPRGRQDADSSATKGEPLQDLRFMIGDDEHRVAYQAGQATLKLEGLPHGTHHLIVETKATRSHSAARREHILEVAPWHEHFLRDYSQVVETAQKHLADLPTGATPRILEARLRHAYVGKDAPGAQAIDAWVQLMERAHYGLRPVGEREWIRFVQQARGLIRGLERSQRHDTARVSVSTDDTLGGAAA